MMRLVETLYIINITLLALYGFNTLLLTWLYRRRKQTHSSPPLFSETLPLDAYPSVTVQLPIYNERHVVDRLIDAATELDWPADKLQIQILDDSTDETREIIAAAVARYVARGVSIQHLHRTDRSGFKAGALQASLSSVTGEFVAIFDADFVPQASFLKELMPHFSAENIGCVQSRWGHLNADFSLLTRVQALGIDGHFIIQQTVRDQIGAFFNFNGTAGIWRRDCIEDAGGWEHDTLTEDLDLSYRAQLRGWRLAYHGGLVVPGELPVQVDAFKRQQFRWAKGSIQTAVKLLGVLWRSAEPLWRKILSTFHLTNYAVHPLMLMNLVLILPMTQSPSPILRITLMLTFATIGPLFMYFTALQARQSSFWSGLGQLGALTALGTGLSLNNSKAVFEAIFGVQSDFKRTPKFAVVESANNWQQSSYRLPTNPIVWVEVLIALYAISLLIWNLTAGTWWLGVWLLLYACGYSYVAGLAFLQARQARRKK
ncbi:MAG: glycosyltransferase [Candidatus Promineifilaceae bacterium]